MKNLLFSKAMLKVIFLTLGLMFFSLTYAYFNPSTSSVDSRDTWRCYAQDSVHQRYFDSNDDLSRAMTDASRTCRRYSRFAASCSSQRSYCARSNGDENWKCYAYDRPGRRWNGTGPNTHAAQNDALFRCQKYSGSSRTCSVRSNECIRM